MTLYENKGTYQTEEGMFQMAIQQASKELGGIVSPNNMDVFQKFAWDEYKKIKDLFVKVCDKTTIIAMPTETKMWGDVKDQTIFIDNRSGSIMLEPNDIKQLESSMGARFLGI